MVAAPAPPAAPGRSWTPSWRAECPGADRERSWYVRFGKARYLIIDTSPTPQHDRQPGSGPTTLADPGLFANGPPHELLAALRRSSPVVWQDMEGQSGFFAVLT